MNAYIKKLENYPIGACGTALGFITLSNAWGSVGVNFLKPIAVYLAIIIIVLKLIKLFMHPRAIIADLKNPIAGSFYTTVDMASFLIAAYFHGKYPDFARGLWLFCVIVHFTLVGIYTFFRLKNHKFSEVIPSWYVTYVGIVTGTLVGHGMGFPNLSKFMLYFGLVAYIGCYPFMLYKIFTKKLTKAQITTTGIMAAPGGLVVGGLVTVYKYVNPYILGIFIVLMIFNVLIVYYFVGKLFKNGFVPGFAAFTFPLAVSTLATYKVVGYFKAQHMVNLVGPFKIIAMIELIVTSCVIAYVLINFIVIFFKAIGAAHKERIAAN
ncbi:MAG: TDT family transporter [Sarcina sp.]